MQCGPFTVVSLMSADAVRELGLEPGSVAVAVVKATTVIVETPKGNREKLSHWQALRLSMALIAGCGSESTPQFTESEFAAPAPRPPPAGTSSCSRPHL